MKINAVFFDIDGTYFDHVSNRVLPETIQAVQQLQKNGYKVALCSGRPHSMALQLPVFQDIQWDGFIGGSGISVYNEAMELLCEHSFTTNQLQKIFTIAKQHHITMLVNGSVSFVTRELQEEEKAIMNAFHLKIPTAVHDWTNEKIDVFSMFKNEDFNDQLFAEVENIHLQPSCESILDITRADVNKAKGIHELMNYWDFPMGSYVAFGDSMNDCEMLKEAAIGIAMGNAMKELLPYADHICGSSDTPAIYTTLKEIGLLTNTL